MRYGRDYNRPRYGGDFERMRFVPREGGRSGMGGYSAFEARYDQSYGRGYGPRPFGYDREAGYGFAPDRSRAMGPRGRGGYDRDLNQRWGYGDFQSQGSASSYPGSMSRGLPGAGPYPQTGWAESHLRSMSPWHTAVPGTGVGYSLPYGMGRGRWL